MRRLLILFINFYQRFISPYKGFRCAHAVYHHGPSCSSAVKTIIRQYGLLKGMPAIRARFGECKQAYLLIKAADPKEEDSKKKDKPSRCERLKDQCGADCITSPCDILSSCRPGKGPDSSCDINPCDSSPCDAGPCDCSF